VDVNGGEVATHLRERADVLRGAQLAAVRDTMKKVSTEILQRGRDDISSAGKFGARWTSGLQVAEDFGPDESKITVFHTVPYWRIFEVGGSIHGKPLLWIPLSGTDAEGQLARNYSGGLFRIKSRSGLPLLMSKSDRQPKFFGKESVFIPKKFHLVEIAKEVAEKMRDYFNDFFSRG
jgi:hypothetical protein